MSALQVENTVSGVRTFEVKASNQGSNHEKKVRTLRKVSNGKGLNNSEVWLSMKEGSNLLGVSEAAIRKRIKKGEFKTEFVHGNGGKQYRIALSSLPESAQLKYYGKDYETEKQKLLNEMKPWQQETALKRYAIIQAYLDYIKDARKGQITLKKAEFVRLYNQDLIESLIHTKSALSSEILGAYKTLDRWLKDLKAANWDTMALAPGYGQNMGKTLVSEKEAEILKRFYNRPNKVKISDAIKALRKKLAEDGIYPETSDATYYRWIKRFVVENDHFVKLMRDGEKALNDHCAFYLERSRNQINVGDILVVDGHVFNFDIKDPFTGVPRRMILVLVYDFKSNTPVGYAIGRTENTRLIAAAYGNAIQNLGFVPRVFYLDNGKAFRAKYFTKTKDFKTTELPGLFDRLKPFGYKGTTYAWAYHGQSKTVERFFGILDNFEREVSSFRGSSINGKVARLHRNETFHRALYERFTGGASPTAEDIYRQMKDWVLEYVETPSGKNSALKGRAPGEVFMESREIVMQQDDYAERCIKPDELRFLMMEEHTKAIYRNGIRMFGRFYHNEMLYGYQRARKAFRVKYDLNDASRIWVYDAAGKYICQADATTKVHPMARLLGADEDVQALKDGIDKKKELAAATMNMAKAHIHRFEPPKQIEVVQEQPKKAPKKLKPVKTASKKYDINYALGEKRNEDSTKYSIFKE